jgi:hypothetical protein
LTLQGLGVAVQRVSQGWHFHLAALAHHGHAAGDHDDDDDDDDDHHESAHFHAALGYHAHEPQDKDVVYVDDGHVSFGMEASSVLKRLALDQELIADAGSAPRTLVENTAPFVRAPRLMRSHVAEPVEPPPRRSPV